MRPTSPFLVLLQSVLSAAAPRVSPVLRIPDNVTPPSVLSTSFSGSGCPQGTTGTPTGSSHSWEHFSFDLPSFKAQTGPSSGVAERTVNCQAHVSFEGSPTGWQFALKEHWSRGHFETDGAGVTLTQYITTYFSQDAAATVSGFMSVSSVTLSYAMPCGTISSLVVADRICQATTVRSVHSANLTVSKSLNLHTRIPEASLIWSPCTSGSLLNVNFRMAFTGRTSNVTAFYGAGKSWPVSEQWGWAWRRC